jgi:hypothetical protein
LIDRVHHQEMCISKGQQRCSWNSGRMELVGAMGMCWRIVHPGCCSSMRSQFAASRNFLISSVHIVPVAIACECVKIEVWCFLQTDGEIKMRYGLTDKCVCLFAATTQQGGGRVSIDDLCICWQQWEMRGRLIFGF